MLPSPAPWSALPHTLGLAESALIVCVGCRLTGISRMLLPTTVPPLTLLQRGVPPYAPYTLVGADYPNRPGAHPNPGCPARLSSALHIVGGLGLGLDPQ